QLYAEHKEEAIGEFIGERLQSYYLANPEVAYDAASLLGEARELATNDHPRAALALAAAAVEVAVKSVLIEPIVHGLVHSESLAALVTELSLRHTQMDRFKGLLFQIIADQGGGDLRTYRCAAATKP